MSKQGEGTLRLILQKPRTCSKGEILKDSNCFLPYVVNEEDIEEGDYALLPSGEVQKMIFPHILDYLASQSLATKKICVMPDQFSKYAIHYIVGHEYKDGEPVYFFFQDKTDLLMGTEQVGYNVMRSENKF